MKNYAYFSCFAFKSTNSAHVLKKSAQMCFLTSSTLRSSAHLEHFYSCPGQEKLGRLHETYEPLNVSFVDLYQSSATASSHSQSFESQAKSSSSGWRSDSGSSLAREGQGAQGEGVHRSENTPSHVTLPHM